ncbi:MAG: hypothetical protein J6A92_00590 [Lachnospiraceae bacterium]|nr:hypothetical protein [Lachnospiraceae bacterium]
MLAEKNEYLKETAQTVFRMSAEEQVIKRCRDREDYYADLRSYQKAIAKMESAIEEKDAQLKEQAAIIAAMEKQIKEMQEVKHT